MDKKQMTERILNLTLEIIYVLTGEDYVVVKKQSDSATDCISLCGSEKSHSVDSPPTPVLNEQNNDQKILEPTNKLLHFLTGEAPERCEDITVRFTMEEQDCLEEDQKDYREVVIENPQHLDSQDRSGTRNLTEKRHKPPLMLSSTEREHPIKQHYPMDRRDGMFSMQCKEEENPADINTAGGDTQKDRSCNVEDFQKRICEQTSSDGLSSSRVSERCHNPHFSQDYIEDDDGISQDFQMVQGDGMFHLPCKEEEIPTEISPEDESIHWESPAEGHPVFSVSESISKNSNMMGNEPEDIFTNQSPPGQSLRKPTAILENHPGLHNEFHLTNSHKELLDHLNAAAHQTLHREKLGRSLLFKSKTVPFQKRGRRQYVCPDCGKSYKDNAYLLKHQRVHTGEKPFSCSDCGKSFTHKSTLVKHQRLHTGVFSCSDCGKCFSDKTGLIIHRRIHTGEKPFVCSECGRRFTQMPHLVAHQSTHKSNRPFSCADCGKCFSIRSVLVAHQMVHTREKTFACSECGKCFAHKSGLATHQRIHTT
ncbi:oocyte zinc finger protein XlCOF7.1-like isoform X3 [Pelobates fuscus]|uniref:oocyte zinc finger protein XlCOF7.1-like isoform X3 n=1 Tax=Pelobates fuscus TaxID=191477 RepID=UPI002FE4A65A